MRRIGSDQRDFPDAPALLLCAALLAVMLLSLMLGRYAVPLGDIVRTLFTTPPFGATHHYSDVTWVIVEIVRLPRVLEVTLAGIALGMAGAAMQGTFRNPLVGPEVTGVTTGAAFGGALGILLDVSVWGIVGISFAMGLAAQALAFAVARLANRSGFLALILAGVIVAAFFGALLGMVTYLADPQSKLPAMTYWLLGSFTGATYGKAAVLAGAVLVAGTGLMGLRWRINLLSLDETDAGTLGVNAPVLRWTVVALSALLVAAQVSVSGGIGFVGLIVPHFARMLVGAEHGRLIPVSAFLGGIYMLILDDLARTASAEIPIGLLTALLGAPIFGALFWRYQGRGWSEA